MENDTGLTGTYQILPPLSRGEYEALKADILKRGVLAPPTVDEHGEVLDGHHRLRAIEELRAEGNEVQAPKPCTLAGLSEAEKLASIVSMHVHRRQLSREQRRDLVDRFLQEDPQLSDGAIAEKAGVTDKTVAARRRATPEIPGLGTRTGRDGRKRKIPTGTKTVPTKTVSIPAVEADPDTDDIAYVDEDDAPWSTWQRENAARAEAAVDGASSPEQAYRSIAEMAKEATWLTAKLDLWSCPGLTDRLIMPPEPPCGVGSSSARTRRA